MITIRPERPGDVDALFQEYLAAFDLPGSPARYRPEFHELYIGLRDAL
jgi:hypothetical protein